MKKLLIIWLFCFVGVYTFGQDFCMYSSDGEKVCYEISASKMLIKSEQLDISDIKNALQSTEVGSLKEIDDLGSCLFLVEMQNTSKENIWELICQLNAREDVVFASPVILDKRGVEAFGYTNELFVNLKSPDDLPILQKIAEEYQMTYIRFEALRPLPTYLLTLSHNSKKDAMQTALELSETRYFEYAQPSFVYLESYILGNFIQEIELIHIYPNPVSDVLFIDLGEGYGLAFYDIRLYNSRGSMLRQVKTEGEKTEVYVADLPAGIYILHIYERFLTTYKVYKIIVKH